MFLSTNKFCTIYTLYEIQVTRLYSACDVEIKKRKTSEVSLVKTEEAVSTIKEMITKEMGAENVYNLGVKSS